MSNFDEIEFLRRAVQIDSSGEVEKMRDFLVETLESYGFSPEVDEYGNTICTRGSGKHLVLNTHLDTVKPHIKFEEDENRIYGRGSCDAKAPLSVMLKTFIEADVDGRLTLAVTPDEETGTRGSYYMDIDADAFIVGEPTDLTPCYAARGVFKAEVLVKGRSAHASEPEEGINAIKESAKVINRLEKFQEDFENDSDLPRPNLSATIIEGGEASNQIPSEVRITLDRRSIPGETPAKFISKLQSFLEEKVDTAAEIKVRENANTEYFLAAFETDRDAEIVENLSSYSGRNPGIFGAATEASRFSDSDVLVFGPGVLADEKGGVAHSDREYVQKEQVIKASQVLIETVEDFLTED